METSLEAELDEDRGYSRYDYKDKEESSRNSHSSKTLRTSFGDHARQGYGCLGH